MPGLFSSELSEIGLTAFLLSNGIIECQAWRVFVALSLNKFDFKYSGPHIA